MALWVAPRDDTGMGGAILAAGDPTPNLRDVLISRVAEPASVIFLPMPWLLQGTLSYAGAGARQVVDIQGPTNLRQRNQIGTVRDRPPQPVSAVIQPSLQREQYGVNNMSRGGAWVYTTFWCRTAPCGHSEESEH